MQKIFMKKNNVQQLCEWQEIELLTFKYRTNEKYRTER